MINDNNIPHGVISPVIIEEKPLIVKIVETKVTNDFKYITITNGNKCAEIALMSYIAEEDVIIYVKARQEYLNNFINKFGY